MSKFGPIRGRMGSDLVLWWGLDFLLESSLSASLHLGLALGLCLLSGYGYGPGSGIWIWTRVWDSAQVWPWAWASGAGFEFVTRSWVDVGSEIYPRFGLGLGPGSEHIASPPQAFLHKSVDLGPLCICPPVSFSETRFYAA